MGDLTDVKQVAHKINHVIQSGWIVRPFFKKHFWSKELKIVLGDNNRNFASWRWQTVDISNADFILDFRKEPLPFKNNTVQMVFTSHMIEHISDESVTLLFNEVHRILRPGGVFRVVCPDLDKILNAYKNNDLDFFINGAGYENYFKPGIESGQLPKESLLIHNNLVRTLASYADTGSSPIVEKSVVDEKLKTLDKYGFSKWCVSLLDKDRLAKSSAFGHINAFDYDRLKKMLEATGFVSVERSRLHESRVKELKKPCFDLERHDWISLYVEGVKGGF